MRRLATLLLLVCAAAGAIVLGGSGGGGPRTYRVDALFYNAAHLIPGQSVKIAGAEVGSVDDVKLTRDRRARVQMSIDAGFAPFRTDAKCTIRPQSLIGEKFVQCNPGSPKAPELRGGGGHAPTIAVTRNEVPVDLDLVFDSLRLPHRQRLALIVNELGTGLAGRPRELNQAIRLANPALAETNRVLQILDHDRARLGRLIDASDTVIAELARRRGQVQSFVDHASGVAYEVASRRGDLDVAIRRLPPLLAELEPTAGDLSALARQARPVLIDLRAAAPGVRALAADLDPLNAAARPALVKIADMSHTGRRAVRAARPVAALLRPVAGKLAPITAQAAALLDSLRSNGAIEGLQTFTYLAALATSRFDRYSHILPSYQIAGSCQQWATAPVAGCSAHFAGATGKAESGKEKAGQKQKQKQKHRRRRHRHRGGSPAAPATPPSATPPSASPPPAVPSVPVPDLPRPPASPVDQLLDFLLGQ